MAGSGIGWMKEPSGMIERLRNGWATALDLEYVEYQIGITTNRTEAKLLRHLRARMIAGTLEGHKRVGLQSRS